LSRVVMRTWSLVSALSISGPFQALVVVPDGTGTAACRLNTLPICRLGHIARAVTLSLTFGYFRIVRSV